MDPLPKNNKRFFASEEGEISEFENNDSQESSFQSGYFDSIKRLYIRKINNFALFGICENEWYPLITEYEREDILSILIKI